MGVGAIPGTIEGPNAEVEDRRTPLFNIELQMQILNQLQMLVELQSQAEAKTPTVYDALHNVLLQFIGLVSAVTFGVFSILAWQVARAGNTLASQANQLALYANELTTSGNCVANSANMVEILNFCQSNKVRNVQHRIITQFLT
ncbi:hypothetical protein F4680DRAFT_109447 [Xylaria scruposa]|nr:hypothetical protein F4680DRAFT_109447 [Xylaria scruposa]